MLKINKIAEPNFLELYRKKYNPKNWDDYNEENIKLDLKTYIAENEQKIKDIILCVYCEKEINISKNEGHIEHIKPKDKFPQFFQEYKNLSISCNSKKSCGHAKNNKYSNKFINPVEDNPKDFMTYDDLTGELVPKNKIIKDRVEYTVNEVLNLNEYNLCVTRRRILIELHKANTYGYFEIIKENYLEFSSLIEFYEEMFR